MTKNKILVVDDVIESLRTIISIIEKYHPEYIIYQANNGQSALTAMENITPDIIVSDWEMPEMNGIELIQSLKKSPALMHIPIIIATGVMLSDEDLKTALDAGAMDYLRKPINPVELVARMHSAITIAQYQKKLIKEKESKILENAIFTTRVNRFLGKASSSIKEIIETGGNKAIMEKGLAEIAFKIDEKLKGNGWQKFTIAYNKLHPGFEQRLLTLHPLLNPTELKLSALIRLGLSVKELSALMFVTTESMKVFRSRLRKKLELQTGQNLQSYLCSV
ncbi:MAG: response regulator transcription factor [Chlorobi bacterium]|nr:response regulator transcription factor [Chlorobiota bacterium]